MNFSETIFVYDLKLATDDRRDKKFLLTTKLCPLGAVCPLPQGYMLVLNHVQKYSSVFRENRPPPPPKPVYGGKISHKAVTLKTRSRSAKSNKLLILSDLYRLANLVTFHPVVHEITCRQTLFGLILVDNVWQ